MINIGQRRQQISAVLSQPGHRPLRSIAAETHIAKSSVHRHQQALRQSRQFPESELWETAAGEQWLKKLELRSASLLLSGHAQIYLLI